jgi:hypothetical protein
LSNTYLQIGQPAPDTVEPTMSITSEAAPSGKPINVPSFKAANIRSEHAHVFFETDVTESHLILTAPDNEGLDAAAGVSVGADFDEEYTMKYPEKVGMILEDKVAPRWV